MPEALVRGVHLNYEVIGEKGPFIALTPGSRRGYAELSKPSSYVKPITYGAVAPGLFDAIVANRAPPNPVPPPQHNAPSQGSKA